MSFRLIHSIKYGGSFIPATTYCSGIFVLISQFPLMHTNKNISVLISSENIIACTVPRKCTSLFKSTNAEQLKYTIALKIKNNTKGMCPILFSEKVKIRLIEHGNKKKKLTRAAKFITRKHKGKLLYISLSIYSKCLMT